MTDALSADIEFATVGTALSGMSEASLYALGNGPRISYKVTGDRVTLSYETVGMVVEPLNPVGSPGKPFAQDVSVGAGLSPSEVGFKARVPNVQGVSLSYMRYGLIEDGRQRSMNPNAPFAFSFFFGLPTATSAMPKSGTATYNTALEGGIISDSQYAMNGASQFSANFSAGTLTTQIEAKGQGLLDASKLINLGTFGGTGNIAGGGPKFSGTFSDGGVTYGNFDGAFFGPDAQEMGYHFVIEKDGARAIGNVAGARR